METNSTDNKLPNINETTPEIHLNRAQRRAFEKKNRKKRKNAIEMAKQLDYIDLIERLRKLNEKAEKNDETTKN